VPKYLSQQWSKASGRGEVGKLRIVKNQGRTEVSFTLNEELASISDIGGKPASVSAPREHPFLLQSVGGQTLTVFTETSVENQSEEKSESGSADKLALEGIVVQRAECRPAASENYMKLKRLQIEESSKPVRLSQQLDKAVTTNYKPVANHQYNIEYEKKKKEDGKRARADKQQVLDMLFSAFEKHQYYNIKDLVDITKQPVCLSASSCMNHNFPVLSLLSVLKLSLSRPGKSGKETVTCKGPLIYLKEILREIGIYNVKGTHKNTWELKPEYRHYQGEEKKRAKSTEWDNLIIIPVKEAEGVCIISTHPNDTKDFYTLGWCSASCGIKCPVPRRETAESFEEQIAFQEAGPSLQMVAGAIRMLRGTQELEEAPAAAGSSVAAATPQLQGQRNHPSLLPREGPRAPSWGADTAVAHLHLAEDTKRFALQNASSAPFPAAAGYRWEGESQLLAPRIKCGLQRNNIKHFISVSSCCHIGNIGITPPQWPLKGLQGCLAPFCLRWKTFIPELMNMVFNCCSPTASYTDTEISWSRAKHLSLQWQQHSRKLATEQISLPSPVSNQLVVGAGAACWSPEPETRASIGKVSTQLLNLLHEAQGKCSLDPSQIHSKHLSRNERCKPDKHILKQGPGKKQLLEIKMGQKKRNYAVRKYADFLPNTELHQGLWTTCSDSHLSLTLTPQQGATTAVQLRQALVTAAVLPCHTLPGAPDRLDAAKQQNLSSSLRN
ncbi:General transcription factor IIF subunit 2, partial [Lamprotornis superbus]